MEKILTDIQNKIDSLIKESERKVRQHKCHQIKMYYYARIEALKEVNKMIDEMIRKT